MNQRGNIVVIGLVAVAVIIAIWFVVPNKKSDTASVETEPTTQTNSVTTNTSGTPTANSNTSANTSVKASNDNFGPSDPESTEMNVNPNDVDRAMGF